MKMTLASSLSAYKTVKKENKRVTTPLVSPLPTVCNDRYAVLETLSSVIDSLKKCSKFLGVSRTVHTWRYRKKRVVVAYELYSIHSSV